MNIFKKWFDEKNAAPETTNIDSYDKIVGNLAEGSHLIIFKASPRCITSLMIEQSFDEWFEKNKSDNLKMLKINVIAQRPTSNFIEARYSIKHESPQLIWLDHEENVLWHGSHGSITIEILNELLGKHAK